MQPATDHEAHSNSMAEKYGDNSVHKMKKIVIQNHLTSEFNVVNYVAQVLRRADQSRTFAGTREQFWPDALPATTNDSYGYQRELNPGSLAQVCHLTTEPWLLLHSKSLKCHKMKNCAACWNGRFHILDPLPNNQLTVLME